MGLWDHRKTWRFRVNATPDDCISAFTRSFGQRVRVWGFLAREVQMDPKAGECLWRRAPLSCDLHRAPVCHT